MNLYVEIMNKRSQHDPILSLRLQIGTVPALVQDINSISETQAAYLGESPGLEYDWINPHVLVLHEFLVTIVSAELAMILPSFSARSMNNAR